MKYEIQQRKKKKFGNMILIWQKMVTFENAALRYNLRFLFDGKVMFRF